MGPGPQVDLVLGDIGERASLEGIGVIGGHIQPGSMVETVDPILAIGLVTLDRSDIMGFTVVVPGDDLDDVDGAAVSDDGLPAFVVQVIIGHVNPLK